jgi:hypothetical protein
MTRETSEFEQEQKRQRQELREEQQNADDAQALYFFFRKHPELACDANRAILVEYFHDDPMSEETLEQSLTHPALKARLAVKAPDTDREDTEAAILELLVGSDNALAGARANMKHKSITELHDWLEELQRVKELRTKSPEELREIVRRPSGQQFEEVPPLYRTRNSLIALANDNPSLFKSICRRAGYDAVNKILAQPSKF